MIKKRIAVLIFGQFREFEIAIKSWKFLDADANFDKFVSTWDTTYSLNCDGTFTDVEHVTLERIENVIGKLTACSIQKENIDMLGSMKNLTYHIKTCINLMISTKNIYDNVIIIRPDIWLDERVNFADLLINRCPDNIIYTYGNLHKTDDGVDVIMDNLFICNMNTSLAFLNCNYEDYDIHRMFGRFFVDNNLISQSLPEPFEIFIVRSNCRNIPNITQDIVREKYYEWLICHNRR